MLNSTFKLRASKYFLLGLVFLLALPSFAFGAVATQNIKISVFNSTYHCNNGIQDFDETGIDCGGALCPACSGGHPGGGGGGGSLPILSSSVNFSGLAYPNSKIFFLRDGVLLNTFFTNASGTFVYNLNNVSSGNYRYTFYAQDARGGYSSHLVFPLTVVAGNSYQISNIFIPPTVYFDVTEIKQGDPLSFYGYSAPNSIVFLEIKNSQTGAIITVQTNTNADGYYLYILDTSSLIAGTYEIKIKAKLQTNESSYTNIYNFIIGTKTVEKPIEKDPRCPLKGDVNDDCRVNLVDFSITAYWYKRSISPAFIQIEKTQLSGDGKIDLVDFSILAYYWTG